MDNDNPAAFPMPASEHSQGGHFEQHGMTLRDWFAGQALAGLASITDGDGDMLMGWGDMSKAAYKAADAMLEARKVQS